MAPNKQPVGVLAVLIGLAFLVWLPHLKPAHHTVRKSGMSSDRLPERQELLSLLRTPPARPPDVAEWGERNPFESGKTRTPPPSAVAAAQTPKTTIYALGGIFWNETKPSALINDTVVGIGSMIDDATVKEIGMAKVVLNDGAKDIVLVPQADINQ